MSLQTYPTPKTQNPVSKQDRDMDSSSRAHLPRSAGNPLSSKINAVLSTSFADGEFGEVLSTIDELELVNTPITRRQFRLQLQKNVIESNGEVVKDFSRVAEVRLSFSNQLAFCEKTRTLSTFVG